MNSWVYLFAKFTPEALLFEALAIFLLLVAYSSFWVLRKRKHGAVQADVPGPIVRAYLGELIQDAEALRLQLFGLLASAGLAPPMPAGQAGVSASAQLHAMLGAGATAANGSLASPQIIQVADPDIARKLAMLEAKMAEQAKALESVLAEKKKIEIELAAAKAAGSTVTTTVEGGDPSQLNKLQERIRILEGKLAEYSVIEDDLANLKRLQQENAALKARMGDAPAPSAPTPAPEAPPAAPAAPAPDMFEGLVDQVEKSMQPAAPEAPAAAAAPAAPEAPPAAKPPEKSPEKSDDDLVAEFEKMLSN